MKIVFATNNKHKLDEIRQILDNSIEVLSLKDIGCDVDIPETGTTIEENARQKAEYVWQHYHVPVFADDTGLEVDALGGAPGVYSARYAAVRYVATESQQTEPPQPHDSKANMECLLRELGENNNRRARFRTVIALILAEGDEHLFEGVVEGKITQYPIGTEGFGYDPIFHPDGYTTTFANMSFLSKNEISHRARATHELARFLLSQQY